MAAAADWLLFVQVPIEVLAAEHQCINNKEQQAPQPERRSFSSRGGVEWTLPYCTNQAAATSEQCCTFTYRAKQASAATSEPHTAAHSRTQPHTAAHSPTQPAHLPLSAAVPIISSRSCTKLVSRSAACACECQVGAVAERY